MRNNAIAWLLLFVSIGFFAGVANSSASTMYGVTNDDLGYGIEGASLITIDPATAATTTVGKAVEEENTGLSGLAFNPLGNLYASTFDQGYGPSRLLRLDPDTAAVLQDAGTISDGTNDLFINDLAFQPSTGALFGIGYSTADWNSTVLYSIDTTTAFATAIGTTNVEWAGGLAFSSSGELFTTDMWPSNLGAPDPIYQFLQLDPLSGATLDSENILLEVPQVYQGRTYTSARLEGLGVRPEDGAFFASWDSYNDVYQRIIDGDGTAKWRLVGYSDGDVADIDFQTDAAVPLPGTAWLLVSGLSLIPLIRKNSPLTGKFNRGKVT